MNCKIDLELSAPRILGFGQSLREAHIKNPNNETVPEGVMQGLENSDHLQFGPVVSLENSDYLLENWDHSWRTRPIRLENSDYYQIYVSNN